MPKVPTLTPTARDARGTIAADAVGGLDAPTLLRRAMNTIARAVPYDGGGLCTNDPDTLLWTGGYLTGLPPEVGPVFFETELLGGDVMTFREMVGGGRTVDLLSRATGGELDRSVRFRRMYRPHGMGPELRVALTAGGRVYGTGCLLRREDEADFSAGEIAFVADVAERLGEGLRAALSRAQIGRPGCGGHGVLVVDDEMNPLSMNDDAAQWLEQLPTGLDGGPFLPAVVYSVVARAKRCAAGEPGPAPRARVRTDSGRWLGVHASALSGDTRGWAVVLEPARPTEMLPLIAAGNDLTQREQEVLGLLLRGVPDKGVAQKLVLSDHTAREHARRVLQKFGVRSRGELQALLFEESYDPWFASMN